MSTEASEAQDLPVIEGLWAGGSDGMQVTDTFLELVHSNGELVPTDKQGNVAVDAKRAF
ncbi:hypothetical protein HHX47_DHR7000741 [Lentinula edodes]|nr:hypothetical protein HHX47_DHR7000741 [Lentinula edodes]